MPPFTDDRVTRLLHRRNAADHRRRQIVTDAEAAGRQDLSDDEDTEFRSLTDDIARYDERIGELGGAGDGQPTEGAAAVRRSRTSVSVGYEARTYRPDAQHSYFRDLLTRDNDYEAQQRLARHAEEVRADESRALTRTDGAGGFFVPPAWLMSQWIELARPSRVTANLVNNRQLPAGTDSINIPKVATGTSTAIQTGDNVAVSNTDLADTSVSAPVRTIAGQQDVAYQLLDQSPVAFDEVIFQDLAADYAQRLDLQVIGGTGSNGQVLGIRGTGSIETVTWTDTTPTLPELFVRLADAVNRVATLRFRPATAIVMHPRRWNWILSRLDPDGRPFVVSSAGGPSNAVGISTVPQAEGSVGTLLGVSVYVDPNIPTDVSSTQDVILVLRADDLFLWESSVRTRSYATPVSTASTLTQRLEMFGYIAFTAARYPKSIVEIGGSGLTTPTFV